MALSWVGNFVKPIVEQGKPHQYWFTFYGDSAKLRIWTDETKTAGVHSTIQSLLGGPLGVQMVDATTRLEEDLTLVKDLGWERFCPQDFTDTQKQARAELILTLMHATCQLVLSCLRGTPGDYWGIEPNSQKGLNPEGSVFESLHHLFCNSTRVPTPVYEIELLGLRGYESLFGTGHLAHRTRSQPTLIGKRRIHF